MRSKTSQKNGNGHHSETLIEDPSARQDNFMQLGSESYSSASQTEVEEVEGFTLLKRGEADQEDSNRISTEADESSTLEEAGFEVPTAESQPLDALFASYSELLQPSLIAEVIIGADNRVRISNTTVFPWRAICGLKITANDNSKWIGTGWLVAPRTVITAGHCVYMHDHGGWPKSIEVIPGLNDASRPYSSGVGTSFKSVTGWTQGKNRDNDYGAIILPSNYRPGDQTGYFGYAVKDDAFLMGSTLNLSGYPGDKGGNQQWFMALNPKSVSGRVITYDIDTVGGQSGAPVWIKIGNDRYCVGIHTNGLNTGNSATRIVTAVFNNIKAWKALGM